ncbi:serine/threonine-protein kinase [Isoptericola sp. NPDC056578]|uniref:serine/threonine-protein kinase n=1 Tax=Isoptericola sp. NPDC056578 TaxID=3345870 RepID=UPI00369766A5
MTPKEPADEPTAGHVVLGGKYVLGDILGTGGTYTVYEATRLPGVSDETGDETGDETADGSGDAPALLVKVLHPHLVDDEAARASLAREVAASDLMDHPGVAKVLDTGEDEVAGANVPWLLMRRLPGTPLSELAGGTGLPWPVALSVVGGLLEGIAAVHEAGLVHRDVGPRNVVVDRHDDGSMTVGLLDLGLTAPGGGDGEGERVAGSASYMSPEQAQGRPLDGRSDLYSVGALAYFALTGHPPYERARPGDVLLAHVGAPVPAPSARRAAVPAAVDRFVARAMAKNPARRFATAGAMAETVATLLAGAPRVAVPHPDAGPETPDGDQTMTMGQIAAQDPHRTAAIGAAGLAAAAAAAEAELQRTRMLGAVDATEPLAPLPDDGEPTEPLPDSGEAPTEMLGGPPAEPPADTPVAGVPAAGEPEPSRRRRILLIVVAALLVAALGAGAFWFFRDADGGSPVAPVTHSPSPSPTPSRTPTTTAPTTQAPDEPTSRPDRTSTPTPTGTPTPSVTPSETSTPPPTSTPTPTDEPTSTPTPTDEPTSTPTPTDEPTEPDPDPTDEETTPPAEPDPTDGPVDDAGGSTSTPAP